MRGFVVRIACVGVVLATGFGVVRPAGTSAQAGAAYTVTFFGGLGGSHSRGNSINDLNWVSGYSQLADNTVRHATLWVNGVATDLGTLGNPHEPKNSNIVWPVKNTNGVLVGISQTDAPDPWGENWSCSAFFTPDRNGSSLSRLRLAERPHAIAADAWRHTRFCGRRQ